MTNKRSKLERSIVILVVKTKRAKKDYFNKNLSPPSVFYHIVLKLFQSNVK